MKTLLTRRGVVAASAMLAAALALGGCGDDGSDSGNGTGGYGAPDTGATTESAGPVAITVSETSLGPVLTDGDGMTLYLFTEDTGPESTCYDQCAENWPPLTTDSGAAAEGDADASLIGSTEREDGTIQVTYNDHPLYYWVNDAAPGDVNGQGVNGVWFVLDAEGNAVTTTG